MFIVVAALSVEATACATPQSTVDSAQSAEQEGNTASALLELVSGVNNAPVVDNPESVLQTCMVEGGFEFFLEQQRTRPDWTPTDEQFGIGLAGLLEIDGIEDIIPSFENPNLEYMNSLAPTERIAYDSLAAECYAELEAGNDVSPQIDAQQVELMTQLTRLVAEVNLRTDLDQRTVDSQKSWANCMESSGYTVNSFQELREFVASEYIDEGFGSIVTNLMSLNVASARQKIASLSPTEAQRFQRVVDLEASLAAIHNECRRPELEVRRLVFAEYDRRVLAESPALEGEVLEYISEYG